MSIMKTFLGVSATQQALGELFGVTDRTIRNWKTDGLPVDSAGRHDIIETFQWWLDKINKPGSEKEEKSREIYWAAKARREELQVKKLEESVLDKSVLEKVWCERLSEVIRGLEAQEHIFPSLLENLRGPEIRRKVYDYNTKIRSNYARNGKYTPVSTPTAKKSKKLKQEKKR